MLCDNERLQIGKVGPIPSLLNYIVKPKVVELTLDITDKSELSYGELLTQWAKCIHTARELEPHPNRFQQALLKQL